MPDVQAFITGVDKSFGLVTVRLRIVYGNHSYPIVRQYSRAEDMSGEAIQSLIVTEAAKIQSLFGRADEVAQMTDIDLVKLNRLISEGTAYEDALSQSVVPGGSSGG